VYLYVLVFQIPHRKATDSRSLGAQRFVIDFIFVWVLLGILVFYIMSIAIGSALIFAAGNILVEALLIIYLLENRKGKFDEP
jgi:Flp pilus assembly protein TadB